MRLLIVILLLFLKINAQEKMNIDSILDEYLFYEKYKGYDFNLKEINTSKIWKIGYFYFRSGNDEKFNECLSYLSHKDKQYSFLMALNQWNENDLVGAKKYFDISLEEKNFKNKYLYLELFFFYRNKEDYVMAYKYLDEAIKIDPYFNEALIELTKSLDPIDNCEEIVVILNKVSNQYKDPFKYYWKATALVNCNHLDEAVINFNKSINIEETAEAYYGLALVYSDYLKEYKKAENYFKKSIELDCNNLQTLISYAWFLYDTDRYDEADRYFQKVIKKDTGEEVYTQYIEFLIQIELYDKAREAINFTVNQNGSSFITDGFNILLNSKIGLNTKDLVVLFKSKYDEFEIDWLKSLLSRNM